MKRKRSTKLTDEQRAELERRHREEGFQSSRPFAKELGVSENYGAVLTHRRKNPRLKKRDQSNPRWQRAIAVGPVLA